MRSLGLRARLILLIAAALLPVFVLFIYSAGENQAAALKAARAELQVQAELAAVRHRERVGTARQLLEDVASSPVAHDPGDAACTAFLQNLQKRNPSYANLAVVGTNGQLVCHALGVAPPNFDLALPFVKLALAGEPFAVGEYRVGRLSGAAGVGLAVPVRDDAQKVMGAVIALLRTSVVGEVSGGHLLPEGATLTVTDYRGTVVASVPEGAVPAGVPQPWLPDGIAQSAFAGVVDRDDASGRGYVHAHAPVRLGGTAALYVVLSMPRDTILEQPLRIQRVQLVVLLLTALLGVLVARSMGERLIVQPAVAMLQGANTVAAGDLSARVDVNSTYQGELAMLGGALNRMAEALQERQAQLDTALSNTEQERTLLELVLNSMTEGVIAVDVRGRVLLFNQAARKVLPPVFAGQPLDAWRESFQLLDPVSGLPVPDDQRPLPRAIRGDSADQLDMTVHIEGRADRVMRNSVRPLRTAGGELLGGVVVFDDISDEQAARHQQQDAERALRDVQQRLVQAQRIGRIGNWTWDRATDVVWWSDQVYEILGVAHGDFDGTNASFEARLPPDDMARVAAGRREMFRTGVPFSMEHRVVRPGGEVRWVHDRAELVHDAQGRMVGLTGTIQDIDERKRSEGALAQANRALQLLSRGNESVLRIDDEGDLLREICRVAVEVGGYHFVWVGFADDDAARTITPAAYAGHEAGYLSEIHLESAAGCPSADGPAGRAMRLGETVVCEDITDPVHGFYWLQPAVSRGYAGLICLPLKHEGRVIGILALYTARVQPVSSDELQRLQELAGNLAFGISAIRTRRERQQLDAAMLKAAATVREQASLLDKAQEAILVRDEAHRIRFWNRGAERLYGWRQDEAMGRVITDLIYEKPADFHDANDQLLARGEWTGELQHRHRDGRLLEIEAHWSAVRDDAGQVTGVLAINSDIGARKQAQREILQLNAELEARVRRRTRELEEANRELEAFSYSIAHDLRSPLSSIDGFSHLLASRLKDDADDRSRHYLQRIRAGVRQMGELTDALLSLAHVSRTPLTWESVDLAVLARDAVERLREGATGAAVQVHIADTLPVRGDPRLLRQVMENLLGNAFKFSARVPAPAVRVGVEPGVPGAPAVYFVADNGAGFDMAFVHKLFGTFQRLHAPSEFSGTGIGLANVHRIVVKHGGRIWAEAAPGQGATFRFTLAPEGQGSADSA